jgi:zinc protease
MVMAKASLTRGYPRGFETAQQVARSVGQLSLYHLPDSYFEDFIPRVNAVAQSDVIDVAARHIDPTRAVTLIVGDYQAIEASLSSLGLGEPQLLPADE